MRDCCGMRDISARSSKLIMTQRNQSIIAKLDLIIVFGEHEVVNQAIKHIHAPKILKTIARQHEEVSESERDM